MLTLPRWLGNELPRFGNLQRNSARQGFFNETPAFGQPGSIRQSNPVVRVIRGK